MRKLVAFTVLLLIVSFAALGAQAPGPHLKGKVLDSTGLPMASATVKVYRGAGVPAAGAQPVKEGLSTATGDFDLELPAGAYRVEVSAPDFTTFQQAVQLANNTAPLAVTLSLKILETVVRSEEHTSELRHVSESRMPSSA